MKKSTLYLKALSNLVIYAVAIALIVIFVPKLIVFFMPFVIGLIVSALANPPIKFFEEKVKFKRKASSAIFIVLILAIIISAGYGIVVFLVNQGMGLVQSIPGKWSSWQKSFDSIEKNFDNLTKNLPAELRAPFENFGDSFREALAGFISSLGSSDKASSMINSVSNGIGSVANVLIGIIMTVLSAYFFTVEHNSLIGYMDKYLPKTAYSKCMAAYRGLKNAIGGYFKAQLQIELWVYVVTVIGLLILRVDYAVVIALGIAFLDLLPFFGAGLIMVPWGVIALVNHDYFIGIGMFITWGVGQLVRQLIQPKIVGDNVGVAPLPTLILLYIGYKFMGVFGMVVALPIAMIVISLYKEGLFVNLIRSFRILCECISSFRRLPAIESADKVEEDSESNENGDLDGKEK